MLLDEKKKKRKKKPGSPPETEVPQQMGDVRRPIERKPLVPSPPSLTSSRQAGRGGGCGQDVSRGGERRPRCSDGTTSSPCDYPKREMRQKTVTAGDPIARVTMVHLSSQMADEVGSQCGWKQLGCNSDGPLQMSSGHEGACMVSRELGHAVGWPGERCEEVRTESRRGGMGTE